MRDEGRPSWALLLLWAVVVGGGGHCATREEWRWGPQRDAGLTTTVDSGPGDAGAYVTMGTPFSNAELLRPPSSVLTIINSRGVEIARLTDHFDGGYTLFVERQRRVAPVQVKLYDGGVYR